MPLHVSGWNHVRIGPVLRGDRGRFYLGKFRKTREIGLLDRLAALLLNRKAWDPPVAPVQNEVPTVYVFSRVPHWRDYFADLRDHRDLIRKALIETVSPAVRCAVESALPPLISIHVRHGDFRPLRLGEEFAKVGAVRTPIQYFVELIGGIREVAGCNLPVTVFSDAKDEDLKELVDVPNVIRHSPQVAIVDLLLMSKSKVIIVSAGSTFGYWAGFLSEAALILHPDHIHAPIRPTAKSNELFEGGVTGPASQWPPLLVKQINMAKATATQ